MIFVYMVPPDIWGWPLMNSFSDILQTNCKCNYLTIDKLIHNENNRREKNMLKHAPHKHKFDTRRRNSMNGWGKWSMTASAGRAGMSTGDGAVCSPSLGLLWSCAVPPEMNSRNEPLLPCQWWYFDFTFPFPVYHILIRSPHAVTSSIRLHLLKHTQTLLSIWNMVRRRKQTLVFTVRKSSLASGASYYLSPAGQKKKTSLPLGPLIPHLFVLRLQFGKTRLSQSLLRTRTTRWKEKYEKSSFCLTSLIHSNRLDVLELFGNNGSSQCKHPAMSIVEWRRTYRLGNLK